MCMNGGDEKPFACPVPGCKKRYKVGKSECTLDITEWVSCKTWDFIFSHKNRNVKSKCSPCCWQWKIYPELSITACQHRCIHPVHSSDVEFYGIFRSHLVCVVGINYVQLEKIASLTWMTGLWAMTYSEAAGSIRHLFRGRNRQICNMNMFHSPQTSSTGSLFLKGYWFGVNVTLYQCHYVSQADVENSIKDGWVWYFFLPYRMWTGLSITPKMATEPR